MAQQGRRLVTRAKVLARRLGLLGGGGVALGCVALVCALAGAGLLLAGGLGGSEGVVVERAGQTTDPDVQGGGTAGDGGSVDPGSGEAAAGDDRQDGGAGKADGTDGSVPISDDSASEGPSSVVVHVDGAVACPGVYEIVSERPRVNDAVVLAGGLAADADTSALNLAAPVADGQKVHVPRVGEEMPAQDVAQDVAQPPTNASDVGDAAPAPAAGASGGLVNLNTATREELMELSGIGEATADAIVRDREANGAFGAPEDLMRVSGIGEKKFAKIRDSVCV